MLRRLMDAVTLSLAVGFCGAGYLMLHALAWLRPDDIPAAGRAGFIGGAAVAGLYSLWIWVFGARQFTVVRVLFDKGSLQLGVVLGAVLYGAYIGLSDPRRALQGILDGMVIGAVVGIVVHWVSGQPTPFTLRGLVRYALIFLLVLTIFGVTLSLPAMIPALNSSRLFLLVIGIVLVLVARALVAVVDEQNVDPTP